MIKTLRVSYVLRFRIIHTPPPATYQHSVQPVKSVDLERVRPSASVYSQSAFELYECYFAAKPFLGYLVLVNVQRGCGLRGNDTALPAMSPMSCL